jgi:hypothetical protein
LNFRRVLRSSFVLVLHWKQMLNAVL